MWRSHGLLWHAWYGRADPKCRQSVKDATVNGKSTAAVYFEDWPYGKGKVGYTIKITNMWIPFDEVDGTMICFSIRGACTTLTNLTAPDIRDQGVLEFSLYDHKEDGYECCPMFTVGTDPW